MFFFFEHAPRLWDYKPPLPLSLTRRTSEDHRHIPPNPFHVSGDVDSTGHNGHESMKGKIQSFPNTSQSYGKCETLLILALRTPSKPCGTDRSLLSARFHADSSSGRTPENLLPSSLYTSFLSVPSESRTKVPPLTLVRFCGCLPGLSQ